MQNPIPDEIRINTTRDTLTLRYDANEFSLSAEYLRVYSPSAEVRGHGVRQEKLQTGKRLVRITEITAAGNYAVKIGFSDGHNSGLYDWDYLYALAHEYDARWQNYLDRVQAAGASRDIDNSVPPKNSHGHGCGGGCGTH